MIEKETPTTGHVVRASGHASSNTDTLPSSPPNPDTRRTSGAPNGRKTLATSIYFAIMGEVERRRLALGIPMEKLSEFCGISDRAYSKYQAPDTSSGRQATWSVLQAIVDCLFADGLDLRIRARKGPKLDALSARYALKFDRAFADGRTRRELLSEWGSRGGRSHDANHLTKIGRRGGRARREKLSAAKRSELARHAALVRHRGHAKASNSQR